MMHLIRNANVNVHLMKGLGKHDMRGFIKFCQRSLAFFSCEGKEGHYIIHLYYFIKRIYWALQGLKSSHNSCI